MAPRVMIIGLDGATFHFIEPLVKQGRLPNLAGLLGRGAAGELRSTFPPHTAASWTTCVTGESPGNHGILYFHKLTLGNYTGRAGIVTSQTKRGRTIFDVAGRHGLRVAAMHVPLTFPAWPVNGVMISGYPSPGGSPAAVFPPSLAGRVGKLHDITRTQSPTKRLRFSLERIELLTRLCEQVLDEESPDLFMVVYQDSDAAHHYFWRYHDPNCPAYNEQDARRFGEFIPRVYEALDRAVGRLLSHAGPETTVFVVSDHGGAMAAPNAFHLNAWLAQQGWLQVRPGGPRAAQRLYAARRWLLPAALRARILKLGRRVNLERFDDLRSSLRSGASQIDWAHTRAYRFMITAQVEGIALNVAGRQPTGIVDANDGYEELREAIISQLRDLRVPGTGEQLVSEVFRREEVFGHRHADGAPDIVFRLHPLYRVGSNSSGPLFTRLKPTELDGPRSGWHDDLGILIAAGPDVAAGRPLRNASMLQFAPTVLAALGLPASQWMEGDVIEGLFTRASSPAGVAVGVANAASSPVLVPDGVGGGVDAGEQDAAYVLAPQEEESIRERLTNLGYL